MSGRCTASATAIHIGTIVLAGCAIYANSLHVPFVFDDETHIVKNRFVRLERVELRGLVDAAFRSPASNRPLANISFALNHAVGRDEVSGYHIVNVAVHLINGVLVYLLAKITFGLCLAQTPAARGCGHIALMSLGSALIFVAHPLQTQSVTYVVQRMNSLAALFTLLALLLYVRGRLRPAGRHLVWAVALTSWILALGCKQTAATLPLTILLYEGCILRGADRCLTRGRLGLLLGFVAAAGLIVCVLFGTDVLRAMQINYDYRDFTAWQRLLTQCRVVGFYASLLLFPHPGRLNLVHDIAASQSLREPATTLFWLACIAAAACVAAGAIRRHRFMVFCLLWVALHLIIESSILPLEMIFEHRMYLPLVGPAMILSWALLAVWSAPAWRALSVMLLLVVALGVATSTRNHDWRDPQTLWLDVAAKSPRNSRAQNYLGNISQNKGRFEEAIDRFHMALRLDPKNAEALNNMGNALLALDQVDEAIERYRKSLTIRHDRADVHFNLGNALREQGRIAESIDALREAVALRPDFASAHYNLGLTLAKRGDLDEAIHHFQIVIHIQPDLAGVRHALAVVMKMKQPRE